VRKRPGIEHDARPWLITMRCCLTRYPTGQGRRSSRPPPSGQAGTSLQWAAKPSHTLSQTLQPFRTRCQPCRRFRGSPCASVVSRHESNPTQSVSPSLPSSRAVPPDTVRREVPTLVTSYCATWRHCLRTSLAFRLPVGFPSPMFHSGSGTQVVHHRLRTTASCLWRHVAPHSTRQGVPLHA
jgi:hypothetical protein